VERPDRPRDETDDWLDWINPRLIARGREPISREEALSPPKPMPPETERWLQAALQKEEEDWEVKFQEMVADGTYDKWVAEREKQEEDALNQWKEEQGFKSNRPSR
jgi:hypothetical protein